MTLGISEILAVALTVSQVFNKPPEQFKAKLDPVADKAEIVATLKTGCAFLMKEMNAEGVDHEVLLQQATRRAKILKAKADARPTTAEVPAEGEVKETMTMKLIRKIDFEKVTIAYKAFCKGEEIDISPLNLAEAVDTFNKAMTDLPDHAKLKGLKLPGASMILDRDGNRFTEIFPNEGRRTFVPIAQLPAYVSQAFISAEDQNFRNHKGLEIRGVIRAFESFMKGDPRTQGGSTITQQVIKNLLVGPKVTAERKMREMVIAARVEQLLSKEEILELYVNYVYLGRSSWGVEMAAQSYFKKSARDLTIVEAAFLAGLTKGPNSYNPDSFPKEAKSRLQYTIGRLLVDKAVKPEDFDEKTIAFIKSDDPFPIEPFESPRSRAAYYFLDEIQRDVKRKTGIADLNSGGSFVVRSTINPVLQKAAEDALQDGLLEYEALAKRARFTGPAGSILKEMESGELTWQELIANSRGDLYDVRFPVAVVLGNKLQTPEGKVFTTKDMKVGLADGSVINLKASAKIKEALNVYDIVYVKLSEDRRTASLIIPPRVQGSVLVMEAKTGRVLAMSGGFSYGGSQLNRVTRSLRQPGSTLKPFIYLSALRANLQPNTLIPNTPISLPPLERGAKWWSPGNFDGKARGTVTIRKAVEKSLNLPTARIMAAMGQTPTEGLDYIRAITHEVGIYDNPIRNYPFVLGAQPTRLIDMVSAYAMISNVTAPLNLACPLCLKPVPHFIDSVAQDGKIIWKRKRAGDDTNTEDEDALRNVPSLDRVSIYQIRRILQGTIERGTAVRAKADLGGAVGGKTGTSNDTVDAWFVGFTNDLVVGVWVGYDDKSVEASLCPPGQNCANFTGGRLALPIAQRIFNSSFSEGVYKAKEPLAGVPPDIANEVIEYPIDPVSGNFNQGTFLEVFRLGRKGGPLNTQRRILKSKELGMAMSDPMGEEDFGGVQGLYDGNQMPSYFLQDSDPRGNTAYEQPATQQIYDSPGYQDQGDGAFYNQPSDSQFYQ